jgi:hypothetical protein
MGPSPVVGDGVSASPLVVVGFEMEALEHMTDQRGKHDAGQHGNTMRDSKPWQPPIHFVAVVGNGSTRPIPPSSIDAFRNASAQPRRL